MNKIEMIDRCIAIEDEWKSLPAWKYQLHCSDEDEYQEQLELSWHKEELENEYQELNKALGIKKKPLSEQKIWTEEDMKDPNEGLY